MFYHSKLPPFDTRYLKSWAALAETNYKYAAEKLLTNVVFHVCKKMTNKQVHPDILIAGLFSSMAARQPRKGLRTVCAMRLHFLNHNFQLPKDSFVGD